MDKQEFQEKAQQLFTQFKFQQSTATIYSAFKQKNPETIIERKSLQYIMAILLLKNKCDMAIVVLNRDNFQQFWIVFDQQLFQKNMLLKFIFQSPKDLYEEINKQAIQISVNKEGQLFLSDITVGKKKKSFKFQMSSFKKEINELSLQNQQLMKKTDLFNEYKEKDFERQKLSLQNRQKEFIKNITLWLLFPTQKPNIENQMLKQIQTSSSTTRTTITVLDELIYFKTNLGKMYHHPLRIKMTVYSNYAHFVNRFCPSANSLITYSICSFGVNFADESKRQLIGVGTKLFCQGVNANADECLLLDLKKGIIYEGVAQRQYHCTVKKNETLKVTFDNVYKKVVWHKDDIVIGMTQISPKLKDKELYLVIRSFTDAQYKVFVEQYRIY